MAHKKISKATNNHKFCFTNLLNIILKFIFYLIVFSNHSIDNLRACLPNGHVYTKQFLFQKHLLEYLMECLYILDKNQVGLSLPALSYHHLFLFQNRPTIKEMDKPNCDKCKLYYKIFGRIEVHKF